MKFLFLILLCVAFASALVDCDVNCDETPDVGAVVRNCLADHETVCERCELAMHRTDFNDDSKPRCNVTEYSNCSHIPADVRDQYMCIPFIRCYGDQDVEVQVQLRGTCDPATLSMVAVAYITYTGPATFVGPGLDWGFTSASFANITFDGNGTQESMFDGSVKSDVTMTDCEITGFNGPHVLKAKARDRLVEVALYNPYFHDIPGKALHFEGLSGIRVSNFKCERCELGSELYHHL